MIALLLPHMVVFLGMMVNTVASAMLAYAVIPSLIESGDASPRISSFRGVLIPVFLVSALLTGLAFGRAVYMSASVMQQIYPRFAI
jgi:hypothetical protein